MHRYIKDNECPKSMPRKEAEALLITLKEIREVATMKNASFFAFDENSKEKMDEIRELSHVWRTSWILSPLDVLIARYEKLLKSSNF